MRAFNQAGRSPVHAMNAMAATSQPLSTHVALEVLKNGGNAMDASIAACAMQCVVEPHNTGIGGDCFAMYSPKGGRPIAFNGSGRAPGAATVEKLKAMGVTELERPSAHSVIIPGAVDAWSQLHKDHGHMPFKELLQPAIDTARSGYPIHARACYDIAKTVELLISQGCAAAIYLDNNQAPKPGSVRKLPGLANVLEAIATHGRDAFYYGEYAQEMVDELQSRGGLHTLDDFANAKGDYVTPISTTFRGREVYECPPNGQGVIALLLLNMFSKIDKEPNGAMSVDRIHTELEATRLAYAARNTYVGDPDHAEILVEELLSDAYAEKLCALIDNQNAHSGMPVTPLPEHKDTVYISVVDKDRNACSFINTLFWAFGGGITTKSGITFTNRGMSFSLDENNPNVIAPNKRPLHTIIPAMVTNNNQVELCFGVMGGQYQATGHLQFLTRYYDYGCDIQEAMDMPRFMVNPGTGETELEDGIDAATQDALVAKGHKLAEGPFVIGGSQAIAIDWETGVLTGGSDPRKDGCALGY
jgi:gamma-glutamyltranspeptidase/glutathione hydrolase